MTFHDLLLIILPNSKAEATTDAIALGAVTSPLWLHDMSGAARDMLPILGGVWLVVQIVSKIYTTFCSKRL